MAMTMPIRTNTTIAICIQIQVGDIVRTAYLPDGPVYPRIRAAATTIVFT